MIICIVGGVGSGKSLTTARNIRLNPKKVCFVNFKTKGMPNAIRLKKDDIIMKIFNTEKKKDEYSVNWDFWDSAREKFGDFDIYLDEVHNIGFANSRQAMQKANITGMSWITQIRKVMGSSEKSNIYLITQDLMQLDVAWRRLLHGIIFCEKTERTGKDKKKYVIIKQTTFITRKTISALERFEAFRMGAKSWNVPRKIFIGNGYFRYYDSYQMLGQEEEYL